MQHYVAGFLFSPDGNKLVLVEKTRPDWQAGKFNAVGGKIEPGEHPLLAMEREFREETGVVVTDWKLLLGLERREQWSVDFYFTFSHLYRDVQTMTDETIHTVEVKDFLSGRYPTLWNLRWLVPLVLDECIVKPIPTIYEK